MPKPKTTVSTRFKFTREKLTALRPPAHGFLNFWDAAADHLMLRVSATGVKSFRVYRKLAHRPVKITLGYFDADMPDTRELPDGADPLELLGNHAALNVRLARKLARAVDAKLDVGVNPGREKRHALHKVRHEKTVGELFTLYANFLTNERKKTVPQITWMFERYLGELPDVPRKAHGQKRTKAKGSVNWQRRAISSITRAEVYGVRHDLAKHVGPTTANRVIELISAMYNFAKSDAGLGYDGANPADEVPEFQLQSRERRVESHEAQTFLRALKLEPDPDFADFVLLSVFTGARRGNILRMSWPELSLPGATWKVTGETTKNGDDLRIPLIPAAVKLLRRRAGRATTKWVFPGRTAAGHMGPPRKRWAKFVERAQVNDLHIHDLRRTLGSWMGNKGANELAIMRALGHKTLDAAMVYQQLELKPVRDAMERGVRGLLQAANGGKVIELLSPAVKKPAKAVR